MPTYSIAFDYSGAGRMLVTAASPEAAQALMEATVPLARLSFDLARPPTPEVLRFRTDSPRAEVGSAVRPANEDDTPPA
jgi:hypothetical protein